MTRWQVQVGPKGYVQPFLLTAAWITWCVVVMAWHMGAAPAPMWELITTWLGWVPVTIAWALTDYYGPTP